MGEKSMPPDTQLWQKRYAVTPPITWQGRRDGPGATRFNEIVQLVDLRNGIPAVQPGAFALIGFVCDIGIIRNLGREGAARGPESMRQALGNRAYHAAATTTILDCGDITCFDDDMEGAQDALAQVVAMVLREGINPIVIGGGHESAWGHYKGHISFKAERRIGILNLDSHYDLRPLLENGKGSSGTSFTQMAEERKQRGLPFDYLCIGIQPLGNTKALVGKARELGVETLVAEDLHLRGLAPAIEAIDRLLDRNESVYVSLCLDVFAAAFAPGVSAPQPLGLTPWHVAPLLTHLAKSRKVIGFEIAELSPSNDFDGSTAGLAASMLATFIGTEAF